jgi:galactofuranose transport system permease protein
VPAAIAPLSAAVDVAAAEEADMKLGLPQQFVPQAATALVVMALYLLAALMYDGFCSWQVAINLLRDNAMLGVVAMGMTFVILSGGIDLSVGAVVAFTSIFISTAIATYHVSPLIVYPIALAIGFMLGGLMGFLIQAYRLPPFLVTLAGMFFARGMAYVVNPQSLGISSEFYSRLLAIQLPISGRVALTLATMIYLAVFLASVVIARYSRFGRNVYAIGGSESSALLMGLPVARTKILVYALSGLCSALAGVVATLELGSGNPAMGAGLELEAIAAVVVGGTQLSGGLGQPAGTFMGVLIFSIIQSALLFDERINSPWWYRIIIGGLMLAFVVLQRLLARRPTRD